MTDRLDGPCALHGMYGCCSWCPPIEIDEAEQPHTENQTQQEVRQAMGAAYASEDRRGRPVQSGLINGA